MSQIEKINVPTLIKTAISNNKSREAAAWVADYRQKPDKFPTESELCHYGVTRMQFATLRGDMAAVPAGAANSLFPDITEAQLAQLEAKGVDPKKVEVFSMVHGSASPLPEDRLPVQRTYVDLESGQVFQSIADRYAQNQYEMRLLHSEMSCGFSEGVTRNILRSQRAEIRALQERGIDLPVTAVAALVGQMKDGPYCCDFRAALPKVSDNSDITFMTNGRGLNPREFDQMLGRKVDGGKVVIGSNCLDARAGSTLRRPEIAPIDHDRLSDAIRDESWFGRVANEAGPGRSMENVGHTEFTLGVVLHEKADTDTLALAHYQMTHPAKILIHDAMAHTRFGRLAESRPPVVGVQSAVLARPELAAVLAGQLNRLVSNLDRVVYNVGALPFGLKMGRSTRGFMQTEEYGLVEIDHDDRGLEMVLPAGTPDAIVDALVSKQTVAGKLRNPLHPNPELGWTYPGTERKIGKRITDIIDVRG